jgi:hypothetical protein
MTKTKTKTKAQAKRDGARYRLGHMLVHVWYPRAFLARLDALAREKRWTRSELVRWSTEELLARLGKDAAV